MATIKDVAALCNVSVSTVSRVLNNHPDVSSSAREKVTSAINSLHYVPNDSARDLVLTRADAIGVVVRGAENPFFTSIISAIENSCEAMGYTMVLHQILVGADELSAAASLVQAKRLKGLILLGGSFDYTPEQTASLGVPFVCCTYTNQFGSLSDDAYSSVSIDDFAAAYQATHYLLEQGHTRIAILLDSIHDHSISEIRYRGYCRALEDAGIAHDEGLVIQTTNYNMESAYERVHERLQHNRDFSAIFSTADTMALAAMKALADVGLSVPADCSVISIDGIEMSRYSVPTLTTLVQPQNTLGEEATRILVDVLQGKASSQHVMLETTLRQGGTVAPV